ncbi:MAG TPA: purine-nucleoside phosphorylase [Myxococcota bacterium]|jgi:purine-nucleoside phosphorylase|nr:purine-nucleoside phosphorylase [Myxococcota bacterium]
MSDASAGTGGAGFAAAELARIDEAAAALRARGLAGPKVGVVLGSGLGAFAERMKDATAVPYAEIPHFPTPRVAGHAGRLVRGTVAPGVEALVLQGRVHYYEGHTMVDVVRAVRTLRRLGVETAVVTNASGGVRPDLAPGTLMCIDDHVNLSGDDPLHGENLDALGPRFPDLSNAYDRRLRAVADEAAAAVPVRLAHGVYAMTRGPAYETPAEVRMARAVGADVVGMSTVPEVVAAAHAGLRVCAISCVTNRAAGTGGGVIEHAHVAEVAARVAEELIALLAEIVRRVAAEAS